MNLTISGCALCEAVSDCRRKTAALQNTILGESEMFLVLPSIGPLVPGHVMVITKEHHISLSRMGESAVRDYENLLQATAERIPLYAENLLETEHGSTEKESGGGCIVHTHIHWLPGLAHLSNCIGDELPVLETLKTLIELPHIAQPYILVREGGGPVSVFGADTVPSQFIRQAICRELGREDWDWAVFPKRQLIRETIEQWK